MPELLVERDAHQQDSGCEEREGEQKAQDDDVHDLLLTDEDHQHARPADELEWVEHIPESCRETDEAGDEGDETPRDRSHVFLQ